MPSSIPRPETPSLLWTQSFHRVQHSAHTLLDPNDPFDFPAQLDIRRHVGRNLTGVDCEDRRPLRSLLRRLMLILGRSRGRGAAVVASPGSKPRAGTDKILAFTLTLTASVSVIPLTSTAAGVHLCITVGWAAAAYAPPYSYSLPLLVGFPCSVLTVLAPLDFLGQMSHHHVQGRLGRSVGGESIFVVAELAL